jgi:hypothetical protein
MLTSARQRMRKEKNLDPWRPQALIDIGEMVTARSRRNATFINV